MKTCAISVSSQCDLYNEEGCVCMCVFFCMLPHKAFFLIHLQSLHPSNLWAFEALSLKVSFNLKNQSDRAPDPTLSRQSFCSLQSSMIVASLWSIDPSQMLNASHLLKDCKNCRDYLLEICLSCGLNEEIALVETQYTVVYYMQQSAVGVSQVRVIVLFLLAWSCLFFQEYCAWRGRDAVFWLWLGRVPVCVWG